MTSQQAVDFVNTSKEKLASYTPQKSPAKTSTTKGGRSSMGAAAAGRSPPRKGTKNKLDTKLENAINNSRF